MGYKAQLTLEKNYKIRIKSNHHDYVKDMKEEFALHVKNYYFMGKYKAGMWDGKIHFITEASLMPYGLLLDYIRLHRKLYPDIELNLDDGIKNLFKGHEMDIHFDLELYPRPYQKEAIEVCLKHSKGIIRSATASGKSLVISYIIYNLFKNRKITRVTKALIIVPSTSLVEQFYGDMQDYGLPEHLLGKIYTGQPKSNWDKHIVITTWQSLKNNHDKLSRFHCVIGDECHQVQAAELKKIFSKVRSHYRIGFTGTLPNNTTELYNIKSFLGPVLREYPSGLLAEQGFISKCNVKAIKVTYPSGTEKNDYKGIKDEIFNNKRRLNLIADIVNGVNDNILLLVTYLAEGDKIMKLLNRRTDKEIIFLSGKDKTDIREEWRQKMINGRNIALIATYGIYQQGINIPNLKYAMLASPSKSKIRVLQSVGRTLRLHENKVDGSVIFDIIDDVKFLGKHGKKRLEYYETEGFNIEHIDVYETSFANAIAASLA
jgi:superfamily II DNA or RNA helicase